MSEKVELIAAAQINAFAGPPAGIEFNSNFGFETATRESAGVYNLELEHKHGTAKLVVGVTMNRTDVVISPGIVAAAVLDERHIQVKINIIDPESGLPQDSPFFITVQRVRD